MSFKQKNNVNNSMQLFYGACCGVTEVKAIFPKLNKIHLFCLFVLFVDVILLPRTHWLYILES